MRVVMVARRADLLEGVVRDIAAAGDLAFAYGCDATDERSVERLMSRVTSMHGVPSLVIYSVQSFGPGRTADVEVAAFEESWRQNCLGGFLVARAAARLMVPRGQGSIILVGSTSSILGRADHLNLAVGKFGLRALAQVLSRELWDKGIHVAHLLIDADINEGQSVHPSKPQSDPRDVADIVLGLHRQKRSAWTSEVDVRPWNERFWEHC
jgi:NAD(P)-dependent dehydrogenase (short-subunit alcohol dehydrogenase family)